MDLSAVFLLFWQTAYVFSGSSPRRLVFLSMDKPKGEPKDSGLALLEQGRSSLGHAIARPFNEPVDFITIATPEFVEPKRNVHLQWSVGVPKGYCIQFNLKSISIDYEIACYSGYLIVFDGRNANSPVLMKICGAPEQLPRPIISTQNRIFVAFYSENPCQSSQHDRQGFRAHAFWTECPSVNDSTEKPTTTMTTQRLPTIPQQPTASKTVQTTTLTTDRTRATRNIPTFPTRPSRPIRQFPTRRPLPTRRPFRTRRPLPSRRPIRSLIVQTTQAMVPAIDYFERVVLNHGDGEGYTPRPPNPSGVGGIDFSNGPVCGNPFFKPRNTADFMGIVGGSVARKNSWPWQISIRYRGQHVCGGSIISKRHIITAAHCFAITKEPSFFTVYAGKNLSNKKESETEQLVHIERIILHPKYNELSRFDCDIAILQIKSPGFVFNSFVSPVCLPRHPPPPGTKCYVTGFGETRNTGGAGKLKQAVVPIIDNEKCKSMSDKIAPVLTENMVCAGYPQGGIDSCTGDSGGPMVCKLGTYPYSWVLTGLVSFGFSCALPNLPGIYCRVGRYVDWIVDNVDDLPRQF